MQRGYGPVFLKKEFMHYTKLNLVANQRRVFDPSNKQDLMELKHFIQHNRWIENCPFYLEEYWDNIPTMCLHKYAVYMLVSLDKTTKRKIIRKKLVVS